MPHWRLVRLLAALSLLVGATWAAEQRWLAAGEGALVHAVGEAEHVAVVQDPDARPHLGGPHRLGGIGGEAPEVRPGNGLDRVELLREDGEWRAERECDGGPDCFAAHGLLSH